jgi:hypothetical protein
MAIDDFCTPGQALFDSTNPTHAFGKSMAMGWALHKMVMERTAHSCLMQDDQSNLDLPRMMKPGFPSQMFEP